MEHLAIMDLETIEMILSGEKTIESRFSKNNISPFNRVAIGDVVYLKVSGGDVLATFEVAKVELFDDMSASDIRNLKAQYNDRVIAPDSYWEYKEDASYGTLIYIKNSKRIEPFKIYKKGRHAFVTVDSVRDDFPRTTNNIKANDFDCDNNLHLFNMNLSCKECGFDKVDKDVLFNLGDYESVLNELKKNKWNYDWINAIIDNVAMKNIAKENDVVFIKKQLMKSLYKYNEKIDGSQVPFNGSVINYARHATGTCCRNCLFKWYNIPKSRFLTDSELDYFARFIKYYINNYIIKAM